MALTKYSTKYCQFIYNELGFIDAPLLTWSDKLLFVEVYALNYGMMTTGWKFNKKYTIYAKIKPYQPPLIYKEYGNNYNTFEEFYKEGFKKKFKKKPPSKSKEMKEVYDNEFISMDIHHYLESRDLDVYESENGIDKIKIVTENKKDVKKISELKKVVDAFRKTFGENIGLKTTYLPTTIRKDLHKNETKIIAPLNTNSGSTYRCDDMQIWRKEEVQKVTLHEMAHYYKLDFQLSPKQSFVLANKVLKVLPFTVIGTVNINEAYTEIVALLLNTAIVVYRKEWNRNKYLEALIMETKFSIFQAAKVLHMYGFRYLMDTKIINQQTSIFSYYIVKCALLYSLEDTLNFINGDPNIGSRRNKKKVIKDFTELVIESINNKNFIRQINQTISFIRANEGKSSIWSTMRMTCLDN